MTTKTATNPRDPLKSHAWAGLNASSAVDITRARPRATTQKGPTAEPGQLRDVAGRVASSVFTQVPKPPRKPITRSPDVDMSTLVLADVPLPAKRKVRRKYDHLFDAMRPNQCYECNVADVGKVSAALRKWIKDGPAMGKPLSSTVEKRKGTAGYIGRVWWVCTPAEVERWSLMNESEA